MKVLTPLQKKEVKSIIKRDAIDYKTRFGNVPAGWNTVGNLLSPANSWDVTNITRYDGITTNKDTCRLGDRIKISSIRLVGGIHNVGTSTATIRVMMIQHKNSANAPVLANDVLQSNSFDWCAMSPIKHNTPYTILYDKAFVVESDQSGSGQRNFNKLFRFKKPLIVEYEPGTSTGIPSQTKSGNIELMICAQGPPTATPEEWLTTQVNFYDF